MFKAIDIRTEKSIIILDDVWQSSIETLREFDRNDLLVCQECRHPVRVKAGDVRIWHFAHKHRQDCSYNSESPLLLSIRAVLYKWLSGKFGEKVTLEKKANMLYFPRAIDCWVDNGQSIFAYWILEAGISSRKREDLIDGLRSLGAHVNWVFAAEMLRTSDQLENEIHLTTTERAFLRSSKFDRPVTKNGQTLHYLDHEKESVTTYRGSHLVHEPQLYFGQPITTPLSSLLISPDSGEFVHPGEYQNYKNYLNELEEIERLRKEHERQRKEHLSPFTSTIRTSPLNRPPAPPAPAPAQNNPPDSIENKPIILDQMEARCLHCGELTNDWWYLDSENKLCKCSNCYRSGKY
jgi:hypothetical protein